MPIDMQSEIIAEVIARLAVVESFGGLVSEDSVLRVIDAEDTEGLPDDFIVIQPGGVEELERAAGGGSVRERVTFNITAITRRRGFAPQLRAARLGIKAALPGPKGGLATQGVQVVAFLPETPMPPTEGRRWACHVMPLQVTYVQPLK
ncbi:hypothetical protein [Phytopseudomonas seleniipraecipitans]|uniref:Tail terminator n=1 Tax=Phytopseudomonas seleniipraecipitans TaxID=640205 RepID=A0A1G7JCB8_9GAMM|nr:hypothetical protein [Pseudomonas seleniipraecipitans]SDF22523.1 hypothetical protein SAMN05216381_1066 [Pseudomonas seleniipraecipitans]